MLRQNKCIIPQTRNGDGGKDTREENVNACGDGCDKGDVTGDGNGDGDDVGEVFVKLMKMVMMKLIDISMEMLTMM